MSVTFCDTVTFPFDSVYGVSISNLTCFQEIAKQLIPDLNAYVSVFLSEVNVISLKGSTERQ